VSFRGQILVLLFIWFGAPEYSASFEKVLFRNTKARDGAQPGFINNPLRRRCGFGGGDYA